MIFKIEEEIDYKTDFSELFLKVESEFKNAFAKTMIEFFDKKFSEIKLNLKSYIEDGCAIYNIGEVDVVIFLKYSNQKTTETKDFELTKTVGCHICDKKRRPEMKVYYGGVKHFFTKNNDREKLWIKLHGWLKKNVNDYKKLLNLSKL